MRHAVFTLLLATAPAIATAAPLSLVQDGKPNATIVVQADAPKPVQAAGADLQKYIQKISGVLLPLKTDGKDVSGITLNVGKTESARDVDLPNDNPRSESYAIRVRGDDVYFRGHDPSPTAFAVHSFLQDHLGVRWFAPGDDWEYVPQSTPGTLRVDVKNVVKTPDFSPRLWSGHGWTPDWNVWNLRNKTVLSERVARRNFQNNMYRVFPPSKYGKSHPEYFPLVNGKRYIPANDSDRYWWPCIGNPEVQRITVEYIRDYFQKNPDSDSFSLGMDDIAYMCSDPLCRAMDAHADDYENRKFSDRFYKFVNIIAKEVKKTNPDKYIGTLIYNIARELPEQVPQLEDNVFGFITQNSGNWFNPEIKEADMELTRQWRKRVKHLSRYDYFGFATFTPRVYPHLIDEEMKFDKSLGLEGMYVEMYAFLPHTAPMLWSFAQLQWDTNKNVDALLNDFYSKMYPSTEKTMKAYFDLLEKSWMTERPGHTGAGWEHRNILKQATSIGGDDTRAGLRLLDQAYAQAKTPVEKRRIDVSRAGLRYASHAILAYDLAQQLSAISVTNAAQAKSGLDKATEFARVIKDRQVFWPQALERQDLFGANLRGLNGMILSNGESYLQTNTTQLDNPAVLGIIRVLDWYRINQPGQATQISRNLLQAFPTGSIAETVNAWNWVQENKAVSLIKNGDFENTTANNAQPGQTDWSTQGAPAGWNTWSSLGGGKFAGVSGYNNAGKGIRITVPRDDNAVVLQNVPVQAGKKYLATVWVKPASKDSAPEVSLALRLRTNTGWYTGSTSVLSSNAAASDQWQPLMVSVTIPEGVTGLAMMLGARETEATFDNAAFYEVP